MTQHIDLADTPRISGSLPTIAAEAAPAFTLENYLDVNARLPDPIVFLVRRSNFADFLMLIWTAGYAILKGRRLLLSNAYMARFNGLVWSDVFEPALEIAEDIGLRVARESNWPKNGDALVEMERLLIPLITGGDEIRVPSLGFSGTAFDLLHILGRILIRFKPSIENEANERLCSHGIVAGDSFGAIHVRRGDKVADRPPPPNAPYVRTLLDIDASIRRVFVMTDDRRIVTDLANRFPDLDFFTETPSTSQGFDSTQHFGLDIEAKQIELRALLVEVAMARRSTAFTGWYASNVSSYLALTSDRPARCRDAFTPEVKWNLTTEHCRSINLVWPWSGNEQ